MDDECYCTLCGVCFGIYVDLYQGRVGESDVRWTEFFRVLRQRQPGDNGHEGSWFISGVGRGCASKCWAPPADYDAREQEDDEEVTEVGVQVATYTSRGTEREVVYPVHAACWDIFRQMYASLARISTPDLDLLGNVLKQQVVEEDGRGLRPDWTPDYGGATEFWTDGWADHPEPEPEASGVAFILNETEDKDYLVYDPYKTDELNAILQSPPVVGQEGTSPQISLGQPGQCLLSRLPAELRMRLLEFLPTKSVVAVRLASRTMASVPLGTSYWLSRFNYPNELYFVDLPADFSTGRKNGSLVNWPALCRDLLHPPFHAPSIQNRSRISTLNKQLILRLWRDTTLQGRSTRSPFLFPELVCRQVLSLPHLDVSDRASVIFANMSPPNTIYHISAGFRAIGRHDVLTGLAFYGKEEKLQIGSFADPKAVRLEPEAGLRSLTVGIRYAGIVGLRFTMEPTEANPDGQVLIFGTFDGPVAIGRLEPYRKDNIKAFSSDLARDRRIVSLGLLEDRRSEEPSAFDPDGSILHGTFWYPEVPLPKLSGTLPLRHESHLSCLHQTTFAPDAEALEHLVMVNVWMNHGPAGICAFQFHFDDRDPVPSSPRSWGKAVSLLVDGKKGERLHRIDSFWSDKAQSAGLTLSTNKGRRGYFATADVSEDLRYAPTAKIPDTYIAGIYGEILIKEETLSSYQNFGFLCAPGAESGMESTVPHHSSRSFDDHLNVWIEDAGPPQSKTLEYIFGEPIGSQPNHGFINWIDFSRPHRIKRITACMGPQKVYLSASEYQPPELVGLKLDSDDGTSRLLGRCDSFGPTIVLEETDAIQGIEVGLKITNLSRIIQEILFVSKGGVRKGFRGDQVIEKLECKDQRTAKSTESLALAGIAWSFDLGPSWTGDTGIQPMYISASSDRVASISEDLYPSVEWIQPPPSYFQLRPIPTIVKSDRSPLTPNLYRGDDEDTLSDTNIVSIRVYFNAFLQGVTFQYKDGTRRSIGNAVGAQYVFEKSEDERIFAVFISSYVSESSPRETMAVEGLRFGLVKRNGGAPTVRYTRHAGPFVPFGPFSHNQWGLWSLHGGGSAEWAGCFPAEETQIYIKPNTSFTGLYAEATSTHIRRLGVLISPHKPLEFDPITLPESLPSDPEGFNTGDMGDSAPWLGPSPNAYHQAPAIGHSKEKGNCRLWCAVPENLSTVTIYRHEESRAIVIIGIEFHASEMAATETVTQPEQQSTLLGFRSLWMEHARVVKLAEEERIVGLAVKRNEPNQYRQKNLGLADVKILTASTTTGGPDEDELGEGWISVKAGKGEVVKGVWGVFDNFLESVGLLT